MNTIFTVKADPLDPDTWDNLEVKGVGQEAASSIMNSYRHLTVVLKGFIGTDRKFTPVKIK